MVSKENLTFIDMPYNIMGLEVFDLFLAFLIPSGFLILSFFFSFFLFVYVTGFVGSVFYLKAKKQSKGWGYIKRAYIRLARDISGHKKVLYA